MYLNKNTEKNILEYLSNPYNKINHGALLNLCNEKYFKAFGVFSAVDLVDNILEKKNLDINKTSVKRIINSFLLNITVEKVSVDLELNSADLLNFIYGLKKYFTEQNHNENLNSFEIKVKNFFLNRRIDSQDIEKNESPEIKSSKQHFRVENNKNTIVTQEKKIQTKIQR